VKKDHTFQLEVHIAHACNLACESCSHFSHFHFAGVLSLETAEEWYRPWHRRIAPQTFTMVGGEPTINPKLTEHLLLARRYWPRSHIRLITNGLLLHRHPNLPEALAKVGNVVLQISRHHDSAEYTEAFQRGLEIAYEWKRKYRISIRVHNAYRNWSRRYRVENGELKPYDDKNVIRSWTTCRCKWCMQLYQGKIWKCPILAYLPMVKSKMRLSPGWDHALTYQPLDPSCTQEELLAFLQRREESYCAACPAFDRQFRKPDPLIREVALTTSAKASH
jgi:radical SAM family protein